MNGAIRETPETEAMKATERLAAPTSAAATSEDVELIRDEHEGIESRLQAVTEAPPRRRRRALAELLVSLVSHAKAEEESLYLEVPSEVARRGLNDHKETEHLLAKLVLLRPTAAEWTSTARELQRQVSRHMHWEEAVALEALGRGSSNAAAARQSSETTARGGSVAAAE